MDSEDNNFIISLSLPRAESCGNCANLHTFHYETTVSLLCRNIDSDLSYL